MNPTREHAFSRSRLAFDQNRRVAAGGRARIASQCMDRSAAPAKDVIASANHGRVGHPAVMVVDSDEDLVNKVASIPGAVGVVDVYAINSSVSVVKVAGKLPLEPGYPLHGN